MAFWVYKCNSSGVNGPTYGDWRDVFKSQAIRPWGQPDITPDLEQLQKSDVLLSYQTDRNELVGTAKVVGFSTKSGVPKLLVKPTEKIGVKVRDLKKADPRIRAIPAFQGGIIATLYDISSGDAKYMLQVARQYRDFGETQHVALPGKRTGANGSTSSSPKAGIQEARSFIEGETRAAKALVRDPRLKADALKRWGTECHCCGFAFGLFYGNDHEGFAIVHHLELLAKAKARKRQATVDDVRVVCANCHYIIHRENPPTDVDKLKDLVEAKWGRWSAHGVNRK
jgi:hypothetical protein